MTAIASDVELLRRTATEQAGLVRSGEASARELVEASLAAIERADRELGAFITLRAEEALAEADAIAPGDPRPLCGVPIGIKDFLTAVTGVRTTHGSRAFGDWVPDHDSAHVRRLREAGAIVVGKTNTPELAMRPVTDSARFGPTRNPWNPRLSSGGSSGGSAAAVAAVCAGRAARARAPHRPPRARGAARGPGRSRAARRGPCGRRRAGAARP